MSNGEIILYTTDDGQDRLQLRAIDGSVWLSQAEMAELFQTTPQNVTQHIKTIYAENELKPEATCKDYLQVRSEGERQVQRSITVYRLEMILAVGYRVRSPRGTQFRRWATNALKEYLIKGFVMDDERLKEPGGWDYFDELLERIREIRASEKRFYQKVKDLFTLSADYDSNNEDAKVFFQTIQNKMIHAITGRTAAELIVERANPQLPNMGLTAYKGSRVRKGDITVSKNYLNQEEISDLNRLVTMFLDAAEDRAKRRQQMIMQDWHDLVDSFLKFNERDVLTHAGSVSHGRMEEIVRDRYETFDANRREDERRLADQEHEKNVEAELKQIEDQITQKKPKTTPKRRRKDA